jgi:hypothetical protein
VRSTWRGHRRGLGIPDRLLGLMGIGAGAYIGFKFPEKQTSRRAA